MKRMSPTNTRNNSNEDAIWAELSPASAVQRLSPFGMLLSSNRVSWKSPVSSFNRPNFKRSNFAGFDFGGPAMFSFMQSLSLTPLRTLSILRREATVPADNAQIPPAGFAGGGGSR
jgi:hypothetical protein